MSAHIGGGANGSSGPPDGGRFTVAAQALVFGFPPTPVELSVRRRAPSWRVGGAVRTIVVFVFVAPFVALVPPHAPWAIGSLGLGVILARRRLRERFTLERVEGSCPKCGETLAVKASRLQIPHPLACEACHHHAALQFSEDVLRAE